MARDAGLSAFLVSSSAFGVFCTIKAFRREIESGTLQMALARPVTREKFFAAKTAGCLWALAVFMLTMAPVAFTAVLGAETGGAIAAPKGDVARIWGPALLAISLCAVVPPSAAAVLNRFFSFRFVVCAMAIAPAFAYCAALAVALAVSVSGIDPSAAASALKIAPALAAIAIPPVLFTLVAAAAAAKSKANAAAAICGIAFAAFLPALGNYYLASSLASGGTIPWSRVLVLAAAAIPFAAAAIAVGLHGGVFREEG